MYFCVNNWTSPSNDYAAVACSNNNQAQLHTHVSLPYWSPDVWLGLELLRGIQLGLPAILNNSLATFRSVATIITCVANALTYRKWAWQPPKNFECASCASGWTPLSKFLDPPLVPVNVHCFQDSCAGVKVSRGNSEHRIILNTSPFYEQKRNYKIKFGTHKLLLLLYLYTKSWRLNFFSPGASYH